MEILSPELTSNESLFLTHISRHGDYLPIQKYGRKWAWLTFHGVGGSPRLYNTKREAAQAVNQFIDELMAKEVTLATRRRIEAIHQLIKES